MRRKTVVSKAEDRVRPLPAPASGPWSSGWPERCGTGVLRGRRAPGGHLFLFVNFFLKYVAHTHKSTQILGPSLIICHKMNMSIHVKKQSL